MTARSSWNPHKEPTSLKQKDGSASCGRTSNDSAPDHFISEVITVAVDSGNMSKTQSGNDSNMVVSAEDLSDQTATTKCGDPITVVPGHSLAPSVTATAQDLPPDMVSTVKIAEKCDVPRLENELKSIVPGKTSMCEITAGEKRMSCDTADHEGQLVKRKRVEESMEQSELSETAATFAESDTQQTDGVIDNASSRIEEEGIETESVPFAAEVTVSAVPPHLMDHVGMCRTTESVARKASQRSKVGARAKALLRSLPKIYPKPFPASPPVCRDYPVTPTVQQLLSQEAPSRAASEGSPQAPSGNALRILQKKAVQGIFLNPSSGLAQSGSEKGSQASSVPSVDDVTGCDSLGSINVSSNSSVGYCEGALRLSKLVAQKAKGQSEVDRLTGSFPMNSLKHVLQSPQQTATNSLVASTTSDIGVFRVSSRSLESTLPAPKPLPSAPRSLLKPLSERIRTPASRNLVVLADIGSNASCSHVGPVSAIQYSSPSEVPEADSEDALLTCNHFDEIMELRSQIQQFRNLYLKSRKKNKALGQCLRRYRAGREKLENTIRELKKRPVIIDHTEVLEGDAKAGAELAKRLQMKLSGEAVPSEYPRELRTFATTLYGYSFKAYDYVRTVFSDCIPHVSTVQKWRKPNKGPPHDVSADVSIAELRVVGRDATTIYVAVPSEPVGGQDSEGV